MIWHLDALLGERRRQSVKYRYLAKAFNARKVPAEYVREIAIFAATPGFTVSHICAMMKWRDFFYDKWVEPLIREAILDPEIIALGELNAASVTEEDGKDILLALVHGYRHMGPVPVYGTMWLQARWRGGGDRGETIDSIAHQLGVSAGTISSWLHAHGHKVNKSGS